MPPLLNLERRRLAATLPVCPLTTHSPPAPRGLQGSATLEVPAAPAAAPGCQAALHWLHEGVLGPCWDPRKRLVDDLYRQATPSLHEFSSVLCRQLSMRVQLSVDGLVGYASSWSAYSLYRRQHPQAPDPLVEYRQRLAAALQAQVCVLAWAGLAWAGLGGHRGYAKITCSASRCWTRVAVLPLPLRCCPSLLQTPTPTHLRTHIHRHPDCLPACLPL